MSKVIIETPSRIHITLIDLHGALNRIDGGIGLALMEPKVLLEAKLSSKNRILKDVEHKAERALNLTLRALNIRKSFEIHVKESYPSHIGLGLTTQLSLAVASAITRLCSLDLDHYELAKIVRRGGTSGIGVNAFQFGGFLIDSGHSRKVKKDFLPSSFSRAPPPKPLVRLDFPEDWNIVLACYKKGRKVYGKKELELFKKYCPIDLEEVRKLSHLILMKLLPSLIERDIESFAYCIDEIQRLGFKRYEVDNQAQEVKRLMKSLKDKGAYGVGLSSFGPTLYCITKSKRHAKELLNEASHDCLCWITKARNSGASITLKA
ncbi:MAG: beta-ribofuranosylaminobenzene 5'-phosphate synthase [Nitrososphaerales archaeon]